MLKKPIKKEFIKTTRVNLLNSWSKSWNLDNPIKSKSKQIIKSNSQSTQC